MEQETCVYQYFDMHGALLYVGITCRGITRGHEHARTKDWFTRATGSTLEHYKSRALALDREAYLIAAYKPPFNTQGKGHSVRVPVHAPGTEWIGESLKFAAARVFDEIAAAKESGDVAQAIRLWMSLEKRFKTTHGCVSCRERPGASGGPMCLLCWDRYRGGQTRAKRRLAPPVAQTA